MNTKLFYKHIICTLFQELLACNGPLLSISLKDVTVMCALAITYDGSGSGYPGQASCRHVPLPYLKWWTTVIIK